MNIRQTCFYCNKTFANADEILSYQDGEAFPTDEKHYNGCWNGAWFRFVCLNCIFKEMEFWQSSEKYKQLISEYKVFMTEAEDNK